MNNIAGITACPCMSGREFNECCRITGLWRYFKEQGFDYYDEKYMLKEILAKSVPFKKMYLKERNKISKKVYFLQSRNMTSAATYGSIGEDAYIIATKYSQIPVGEAIHIAHELEHLVLCSMGFKNVSFINEQLNHSKRLHKMINDMVYDPIANKRLFSFGFNLRNYLKISDEIQMKIEGESEDDLFLLQTLFVKRLFDHRNLHSNISTEDIKFNKWVQEKFPLLIPGSLGMIEIIESHDKQVPVQMEKLLNELLKYNALNDHMYVHEL